MRFFIPKSGKNLITYNEFIEHLDACMRTAGRGRPYRLTKLRLQIIEELIEYLGEDEADLLCSLLLFWQYPFKNERLGKEVLKILLERNGLINSDTDEGGLEYGS